MENKIFKRSSADILNRILSNIEQNKKERKFRLYDFLYSEQNESILDNNKKNIKFEGKEPYYGFSKQTATQTMSRITSRKGKLTDEIVSLIAKNTDSSYSEIVWGITEGKMKQIDYLFFNYLIIDMFYDAFLSEKYSNKVLSILKDYIPFTKYIYENNILYEPDKEKLQNKLETEEFQNIFSDAVKRFLILAEENFRIDGTFFLEYYIDYFKSKDNSLRNLSKTIEEFFDKCYQEYFEFVMSEYGDRYGLSAYELLQKCVGLTMTEFEMKNRSFNEDTDLLSKRIDAKDEEWFLKKDLVIATLNYVDTLANYQSKIEEVIFHSNSGRFF